MEKNTKKIAMVAVPIILAGAIIFLLNRKKKKEMDDSKEASGNDVKETAPKPAPVSSVFPIKQGSRGDKVKELQRLIGANPDGIFGPNTENALIQYAGVRVVNSQKEMDELAKKAIGISSANRAKDIIEKANAGGQMYVIKDAPIEEVIIDSFGAVQSTGKTQTLTGGKTYGIMFKPQSVTKMGKLLLKGLMWPFSGTYLINPDLVTIK